MIKLVMIALGFLWPYLVNLFFHLLALLGVGFLTFSGINLMVDTMFGYVSTSISGLPSDVIAIASAFGVGHVLAGLGAGVATRFALAAIGDVKKMVFRKV